MPDYKGATTARALRLSVRTTDFHSVKRGSTPLGRATVLYSLATMIHLPLAAALRYSYMVASAACALRLSVRTTDSHSVKRGSTPLGRTNRAARRFPRFPEKFFA